MKKILLITLVVAFMATPAFAASTPEFDAVGCDNQNYFNDFIKQMVVGNNMANGQNLNENSDFRYAWAEYFTTNAGALFEDPCFPEYESALTPAWTVGTYEWQIVLQMQPESDINVNIVDCVLKREPGCPYWPDVFVDAAQTGRYRAPWGQLVFTPTANPRVTVMAKPGQYAIPTFPGGGFILDARTLPGLCTVPLDDALITSKALWEEGLVAALPETGCLNGGGENMYQLKQGDLIYVKVTIPCNNTVNVRYGPDNVIVKYVGMVGTEYLGYACEPQT